MKQFKAKSSPTTNVLKDPVNVLKDPVNEQGHLNFHVNDHVNDLNLINDLNNLNITDKFIVVSVIKFLHYKNKSTQNKPLSQLRISYYEDLLSYAFIYYFLNLNYGFKTEYEILLQDLYSQYQVFLFKYVGLQIIGKNTFLKIIKFN